MTGDRLADLCDGVLIGAFHTMLSSPTLRTQGICPDVTSLYRSRRFSRGKLLTVGDRASMSLPPPGANQTKNRTRQGVPPPRLAESHRLGAQPALGLASRPRRLVAHTTQLPGAVTRDQDLEETLAIQEVYDYNYGHG